MHRKEFWRLYSSKLLAFIFANFFILSSLEGTYINRFDEIENGGISFTGNALGLSKRAGQNNAGTADSIGAFSTIDNTLQVGDYPTGTTLDWTKNSSSAVLDLPPGSTVLYAELVWTGSYGFGNQITGNEPNSAIKLITPDLVSHSISPDVATAQEAVTPGFENIPAGNYVRSANVTPFVQANGSGTYTVGGIPATVTASDDTHNAAGWTLAVAYYDGTMPTASLTIFVGCEQASDEGNEAAKVEGFCTPAEGPVSGKLFVSAIEGDATKTGDRMLFGQTNPLPITSYLFGPNNPLNNFFCSQINTGLPIGSGTLDTRGTFGTRNQIPTTPGNPGRNIDGGRQGYDITSVNLTGLVNNQTVAYAQGKTTEGGEDYTINCLGIQIPVGAPFIVATKKVNGVDSVNSQVGNTVTFTFTLKNEGTVDASNVVFKDILETGLSFVPGTFKFNDAVLPDPNLVTGFVVGNLDQEGEGVTIEFKAHIDSYPQIGNVFYDTADIDYTFILCDETQQSLTAQTNEVNIVLPSLEIPNIVATKLVNSKTNEIAKIGDVLTFAFKLTNNGVGDALNVVFQDILEPGLTLVPGSVFVDNVLIDPDPDLSAGLSIGIIAVNETVNIQFQAKIVSLPVQGTTYYDKAHVDYQYMPFEGEYKDFETETNTVRIDLQGPAPIPQAAIKKCNFFNETTYRLIINWVAPSDDVIAFRLYRHGKLIAEIPASAPLVFETCLHSKDEIVNYTVAAVYPGNIESNRVQIRINK